MNLNHLLLTLGALLVTLKLGFIAPSGVTEWSWWLVLLPFYVGYAVFLGVAALTVAAIIVVVAVFLITAGGAGLVWLVATVINDVRNSRCGKRDETDTHKNR